MVSKTVTEVVDRIRSGIDGFDQLTGGGIPQGSLVLLSGMCGTGKSTFCMQFLNEGATHGENGIYVTLEEQPYTIIRNASNFGWDFPSLIKDKKLAVQHYEIYDFKKLLDSLTAAIEDLKATRVAIDSTALLGLFFEDKFKFRKALIDLGKSLREKNVTTVMTTEVSEGSKALSAYGVEEYAVDGVLVLTYEKIGNVYMRTVAVRKLRGTSHSMKVHPLQVSNKGLSVFPVEEIF